MIPHTVTHLCFVTHYANDVSFFLPALILSPPSRLEKVASTWKWNAPCCYLFMKMKKVRVCSSTKCSGCVKWKVQRVSPRQWFRECFIFIFFYLLLPPDSLATISPSNVLGPLKRKIKEIYHSVIHFDVCEYKLASTSFCLPVFPRNWKNTNFLIAYGFKRNKHNPELTYRCWLTVTSPRFRHSTLHLASTVSDVDAHLFLSIITSIVVITVFVALWKQQPAIRPCGLTPNAFMNQRQETS